MQRKFLRAVVILAALSMATTAQANWIKKAMRGGTGVKSAPAQPKAVARPAPVQNKPLAQKPVSQPQAAPAPTKQDAVKQSSHQGEMGPTTNAAAP